MERENHTEQEDNLENTFEIVRLISTLDSTTISGIANICNFIRTNEVVAENGSKMKNLIQGIKDPSSNVELVKVIIANSHLMIDLVKPFFLAFAEAEDKRVKEERDLIKKADSILRKDLSQAYKDIPYS